MIAEVKLNVGHCNEADVCVTCSEGGKAGAVNGEAVHGLPCAGTAAAARCGGAHDQAATPIARCVLQSIDKDTLAAVE